MIMDQASQSQVTLARSLRARPPCEWLHWSPHIHHDCSHNFHFMGSRWNSHFHMPAQSSVDSTTFTPFCMASSRTIRAPFKESFHCPLHAPPPFPSPLPPHPPSSASYSPSSQPSSRSASSACGRCLRTTCLDQRPEGLLSARRRCKGRGRSLGCAWWA